MIAFGVLPELDRSEDSSKIWIMFQGIVEMKKGVVYRKSLKVRETFHGIWPRTLSIIEPTRGGSDGRYAP